MKKGFVFLLAAILLVTVTVCSLAASDVKMHYVWGDWTGDYTGEVDSNGQPYGFGLFECSDLISGGYLWRYIGEWKDGLPNGQGTIYSKETTESGTYVNGVLETGERYTVTNMTKEEIKPVTREMPDEPAYIGNKKSMRFHYPDCHSVTVMKDSNKVEFFSREEAIERGYIPCGDCHP